MIKVAVFVSQTRANVSQHGTVDEMIEAMRIAAERVANRCGDDISAIYDLYCKADLLRVEMSVNGYYMGDCDIYKHIIRIVSLNRMNRIYLTKPLTTELIITDTSGGQTVHPVHSKQHAWVLSSLILANMVCIVQNKAIECQFITLTDSDVVSNPIILNIYRSTLDAILTCEIAYGILHGKKDIMISDASLYI